MFGKSDLVTLGDPEEEDNDSRLTTYETHQRSKALKNITKTKKPSLRSFRDESPEEKWHNETLNGICTTWYIQIYTCVHIYRYTDIYLPIHI